MRKTRKALIVILSLAMCLSLFAACQQTNDDTPGSNTSAPGGDTTPAGNTTAPESTPPVHNPEWAAPPPEDAKYADHIELLLDATTIAVINIHNPASSGASVNWAYRMVFNTLTYEDLIDENELMPMLATRWDTDDYQNYTFWLRDDVYFHNGEKFTADDVVFTCEGSKTFGVGAPAYDIWNLVDTVTAVNDYEVHFKLKNVDVEFAYRLAVPFAAVVNRKAATENDVEGYYIGTGPYRIAEFSSRDYVTFERFDDYWGDLPPTRTQTWRTIPEISTRAIMLQNGEADICFEVSEGDLQMFRSDTDNYTVFEVLQNNPQSLHFNMEDPITGDYNFRMAVAHAINVEEITLIALGANGIAETEGTIWGYYTIYRNHGIPMIQQNLDLAKEYLEKSTYDGSEVEIFTALGNNIRAAEAIQEQLTAIGVRTRVEQTDIPSFLAATTWADNNKQMIVWSNVLSARTSEYRNNYYAPSVQNRSKFTNEELLDLLDREPNVPFGPEKQQLCYRMQEIIAENIPSLCLFYRLQCIVADRGIGGVRLPWTNFCDLSMMYKILD